MPLAYQLLMMRMLPWQPWAQLSQYGDLVPLVGEARDALRSVHAKVQRLAALLARVKDSHGPCAALMTTRSATSAPMASAE
jgi:hypothetical protein